MAPALQISQSVGCIPYVIDRKPELFKILCQKCCNFLLSSTSKQSLSGAWLAIDRLSFLFNPTGASVAGR